MATATLTRKQSEITSIRGMVFNTALGPMGLVESDRGLLAVRVGHRKMDDVRRDLARCFPAIRFGQPTSVAELLERYSEGEPVGFDEVQLDASGFTPFREKVTAACRKIKFGETSSYAELAAKAGKKNAYRAVGSIMARNPWPILVPCHRVLRTDGGPGGYSAPQGVAFKWRLLELEGAPRIV